MWGRFTKSWTAAGVSASRTTMHRRMQDMVSAVAFLVSSHSWTRDSVRSVSPGLKTKRTGMLLSGPKLCSLMKVNFAFPLEIKVPSLDEWEERHRIHVAWSQCKVSTVSDGLGCHVICWCWSTVFSEVQGQLSHLPGSFRALPAADQLYGDADFIFLQDLAPAHSAKATSTWFKDHDIPVLNWPANSADLSPIENLWGNCEEEDAIRQTQQCRRAEGHYQSNLGSHNTWAVPHTDRLHATLHCCSNSGKKEPQLSIECCTCSYFPCSYFSVGQHL